MSEEWTEDEMRRALFGDTKVETPASIATPPISTQEVVIVKPKAPATKRKSGKPFTPRKRVTLLVGNEFEGQTFEFIHEADTLSTLLAEQEAMKLARKKYRYVELVSTQSL